MMGSQVKQNGLKALWDSSALAGANASYLEQLYDLYLEDKYDRIKSEIIRTDGEDRICGPRVIHAINSMPTNSLISE